jgi:hypothetical protein
MLGLGAMIYIYTHLLICSGVGIASIQLVRKLKNSVVYVTVGSEEKATFCESLGMHIAKSSCVDI